MILPFAMFFVRSSETNLYSVLSNWIKENCCCTSKYSRKTSSSSLSDTTDFSREEVFFDPSLPLTSLIFKSINYEFMCCILDGLKQICFKVEQKQSIFSSKIDSNLTSKTMKIKKLSFFQDNKKE